MRSAVFGGLPTATAADSQIDGGVKGSEVTSYSSILYELQLANLQNNDAAPQPLPIEASFNLNFRNAIPYTNQDDGILEYVFEGATTHYQFTKALVSNPQVSVLSWKVVSRAFQKCLKSVSRFTFHISYFRNLTYLRLYGSS